MLTMAKKISNSANIEISVMFGTKEYDDEFYRLYDRYREVVTPTQSKNYFITYVRKSNKDAEKYASLPPKKYSIYGIYAKMEADGIRLPSSTENSLREFILQLEEENLRKASKREEVRKEKNIRDSIQIRRFLGDLNYFIDCQTATIEMNKKPNSDISNLLGLYNLLPIYHQQTKELLSSCIVEMELAKKNEDDQLKEAYSYMTNKQLSVRIEFLKNIYTVIDGITSSGVKIYKPRQRKPKKPDQLVKKLIIQERCDELNFDSRDKISIIGSKLLFVYNTKTRFLTKYVSTGEFSVKGSTLLNVDDSLSRKKKIRKPSKLFLGINANNKKSMERAWDSITSKEISTKNRLNNTTLIISCL